MIRSRGGGSKLNPEDNYFTWRREGSPVGESKEEVFETEVGELGRPRRNFVTGFESRGFSSWLSPPRRKGRRGSGVTPTHVPDGSRSRDPIE